MNISGYQSQCMPAKSHKYFYSTSDWWRNTLLKNDDFLAKGMGLKELNWES